MAIKLMYITNEVPYALIVEKSGVDWIVIDLEVNGKEERQPGLDTVKSRHSLADIDKIKAVLTTSELLVRVNPIYQNSAKEINEVIQAGADIVMLPYFKTAKEVERFIALVDKRAKVMLLLETPEAILAIDDILVLDGIDAIHIGLNDLHLGYNMRFLFEPLADGTVERVSEKILAKNIPFGFGGISRLGSGMLPAESILTEHYRLKSSMVILSRSFCDVEKIADMAAINDTFVHGVAAIRQYEKILENKPADSFIENQTRLSRIVYEICNLARPA